MTMLRSVSSMSDLGEIVAAERIIAADGMTSLGLQLPDRARHDLLELLHRVDILDVDHAGCHGRGGSLCRGHDEATCLGHHLDRLDELLGENLAVVALVVEPVREIL